MVCVYNLILFQLSPGLSDKFSHLSGQHAVPFRFRALPIWMKFQHGAFIRFLQRLFIRPPSFATFDGDAAAHEKEAQVGAMRPLFDSFVCLVL